jgi:hypothetical protein
MTMHSALPHVRLLSTLALAALALTLLARHVASRQVIVNAPAEPSKSMVSVSPAASVMLDP